MGTSLSEAVQASLTSVELRPADDAATQLALTYARDIDAGGDLTKLGPALLAVLESLGMTPRGRKALLKGGADDAPKPSSPLDELRARRTRRTG